MIAYFPLCKMGIEGDSNSVSTSPTLLGALAYAIGFIGCLLLYDYSMKAPAFLPPVCKACL